MLYDGRKPANSVGLDSNIAEEVISKPGTWRQMRSDIVELVMESCYRETGYSGPDGSW